MESSYINKAEEAHNNQKDQKVVPSDFGNNPKASFVYKKSEKLTAAMYLITNLVDDHEPLKWKLRESSLTMLQHVLSLTSGSGSAAGIAPLVLQRIAETCSLLEVAYRGGIISEMNYSILQREYREFREFFTAMKEQSGASFASGYTLPQSFFEIEAGENSEPEKRLPDWKSGGTPEKKREEKNEERQQPKALREAPTQSTSGRASDRRETILKALGAREPVTVKDIARLMRDCSEKTVQRELLSMVAEGILRKEGERRWSVYYKVS